jgi:anti-anti-sigma factor
MVLAVSRSNGLDAEVRKNEHHGLVMLAGELDAATAGRLFDTLAELAREGSSTSPSTSLNSISSTPPVVSVLVAEHKRAESMGGELIIFSPRPRVREVFEATALNEYFNIRPTKGKLGGCCG